MYQLCVSICVHASAVLFNDISRSWSCMLNSIMTDSRSVYGIPLLSGENHISIFGDFCGQLKDYIALLSQKALTSEGFKPHSNFLKAPLDEVKTAFPLRLIRCCLAPSVRCKVFNTQQVCFCLCKCDTIWGTLTHRMDKQHAGYLNKAQQRTFLLCLSSL